MLLTSVPGATQNYVYNKALWMSAQNISTACSAHKLSLRLNLARAKLLALVQWLWVTTHVRKVMGSNPNVIYWIDIFSH